jgi:hypothetical protein
MDTSCLARAGAVGVYMSVVGEMTIKGNEDTDEYARQRAGILAAFERLRADPVAWGEYIAEQREWDVTAGDGLAGDPWEAREWCV